MSTDSILSNSLLSTSLTHTLEMVRRVQVRPQHTAFILFTPGQIQCMRWFHAVAMALSLTGIFSIEQSAHATELTAYTSMSLYVLYVACTGLQCDIFESAMKKCPAAEVVLPVRRFYWGTTVLLLIWCGICVSISFTSFLFYGNFMALFTYTNLVFACLQFCIAFAQTIYWRHEPVFIVL